MNSSVYCHNQLLQGERRVEKKASYTLKIKIHGKSNIRDCDHNEQVTK